MEIKIPKFSLINLENHVNLDNPDDLTARVIGEYPCVTYHEKTWFREKEIKNDSCLMRSSIDIDALSYVRYIQSIRDPVDCARAGGQWIGDACVISLS